MKKNIFNLWLLAALMCGLSLSITSCKDGDSEPSAEEKAQQAQEQADIFWGVVDELAGADAITDDYQNKTFEPIIGVPSKDNALYRIVGTNDMETAVSRFNQLIGEDKIDESTAEYTYQNDAVGTLTYHKSTDGKSWATVDVSIKQMPRLERIIYMRPSQGGDNGSFEGTAYYRFGDVVEKTNADGGYEYWICVRPCFGPEEKEHSHWVSVSPLPKKNIKTYKASNGITYALPYDLGDNTEHAQNFAEMLYAICFPEQWERNIINNQDNKKMRMFHDFDKSKLKYHTKYFWQRVQKGWLDDDYNTRNIFKNVFGFDNLATFQQMLTSKDGLNLLTKGYSWWWWMAGHNSPELYRQRFTNGQGVESNMHQGGKITAVSKEVIKSKIELNVEEQYNDFWVHSDFFDTDAPHYIIRHATGAQLSSDGKEDPKKPLKGVNHYWVYNIHYRITDLTTPPETFDDQGNPTNDSGYENRAYYTIGDIVKDARGNRWVCVQPSAYGNADRFKEEPYSYFISFEKYPVVGAGLTSDVPASSNLAAQVLFSLEVLYHKYVPNVHNGDANSYKIAQNMRDNLGVDLGELIAKRDTLHQFSKAEKAESVPCSFVSTLYRDYNNNLYVLRLVADYTVEQANGGRDMSWHFYTNYTGSTTKMLLAQLSDTSYVKKYNQDKWVFQPWYDIATGDRSTKYTGPRTKETSEKALRIENMLYKRGYSVLNGMAPTNMYGEPIIVFAVQRVRDNGVKAFRFDDNTEFTEYKMMKDIDVEFTEDRPGITDYISDTYNEYRSHRIYLEEQNWQFGMANKTTLY